MHLSLVLITFFFSPNAQWPPFFPLFLLSASYNPFVEFRIISNAKNLPTPQPGNVQLVYMTYEDVSRRLQVNLNASRSDIFTAEYPYKLCEFKPMFGVLFADVVEGFDFWGHVDNDAILGDVLSEDFLDPRFLYSLCNCLILLF